MILVRSIHQSDLEALLRLAETAGYGLTTLPPDMELLRKRVLRSERSFACAVEEPGGEIYTLVMEDTDTGEIIGTSSIVSKVGGFQPFYAYRIESEVFESKQLGIRKEIQSLNLVREHSGPTEIGGLFISPQQRRKGIGRLISLCRFLFMAEHPHLFEPQVMAEMRGVVDANGHSPFWEALGRKFFDLDYSKADLLSMKDKRFIADLMPEERIYIPLLPDEAQAVIGQVHDHTRPALKMLLDEGFRVTDLVDIFEAGPIVLCDRDKIRTVRESRRAEIADLSPEEPSSDALLVANTDIEFRCCLGSIAEAGQGTVRISGRVAEALKVGKGDRVRFASPRPSEPPKEA